VCSSDLGQQALDRQRAAAGGRLSGAALKAAAEYGQNFASNEFNNAAQRDAQLRGMQMQQGQNLGNLAYGFGSQQAGMMNQYGQNMANLYGNQAGAAQQYGQNIAGLNTGIGGQLAGIYGNQLASQLGNNQLLGNAYSNYAGFGGASEQQQANQNVAGLGAIGTIVGAFNR
jgi:hypothetical protein